MTSATSTDTARKSVAIYREAARIVEQRLHPDSVGGWSCLAIAKAARPDYSGYPHKDGYQSSDVEQVRRYEAIFLWDSTGFDNPDQYPKSRDHRVIALCLMAAMVEAGDA